jgi:hypothetical protein
VILFNHSFQSNLPKEFSIRRSYICVAVVLLVGAGFHGASAQTTAPAASSTPAAPNPSRMKLTVEKLKEMKAKWATNKPKLRACRKEVRRKGLAGDDRWFYIADCMERT